MRSRDRSFWDDSEYGRACNEKEGWLSEPVTKRLVTSIEKELGYKLPAAYVALMKTQNGGIPRLRNHRAKPTSWAKDHIAIHGLFGIGRSKPNSLCGEAGSRFWIEDWDYPPIGVYFADCPSGGHDMVCLDYRACGPRGEPRVVHVDQERDFKITILAKTFEAFVRGLRDEEAFGKKAPKKKAPKKKAPKENAPKKIPDANAAHPSLALAPGATLAEAQAALGLSQPPTRESEYGVDEIFYHLEDLGFWVFFDAQLRVQSLRYDDGYPYSIEGVRIGDSRERVLAVLGEPHRRIMSEHNWGYYLPDFLRLDFDGEGQRVKTIFR